MKIRLHGNQPEGPFAHAQALQSLVYGWIQAMDRTRAEELHDTNSSKPFSISPLVPSGNSDCVFYVSCLDDSLTDIICKGADSCDQNVYLKASHKVLTFTLDPKIDFESETSWTKLERNSEAANAWKVYLLSPTVCRIKEQLFPLPDPVNYFASWYYRWQGFGQPHPPQAPEIIEFVRDRVVVTAFSGETVDVPINARQSTFPGFVGFVDLAVHKPKNSEKDILKRLDMLTSLAEYSGTGAQTMRGLGQTRVERLNISAT
ncbi:MAG: CRISPR system precrRNA processing endoribonuclease RAMP protein Cas6 [Coriobacteriales bacterium]|nr:CRISPR system precrRNA processing endoribonuclease RAMP protein Cas6 [Coriobacteriales bacterium]